MFRRLPGFNHGHSTCSHVTVFTELLRVRNKAVSSECDTLRGIMIMHNPIGEQKQVFTVNFEDSSREWKRWGKPKKGKHRTAWQFGSLAPSCSIISETKRLHKICPKRERNPDNYVKQNQFEGQRLASTTSGTNVHFSRSVTQAVSKDITVASTRNTNLLHGETNRKVAGSIPDVVIGIFHWLNPSGRTMALESTQPLTDTSTRDISWRVKAADANGWQLYRLNLPTV
jgi:ribosomal protein L32